MATAVKPPSKTTRKKAGKILQAAHDYIEQNGFDIQTYGRREAKLERCYIGTIRTVAGLPAEPEGKHGYDEGADATAGDGPELILALETLDKVSKSRIRRLREYADEEDVKAPEDFEISTGRYIEAVGLMFQAKLNVKGLSDEDLDKEMKADALKMLRKALTELYESGDLQ